MKKGIIVFVLLTLAASLFAGEFPFDRASIIEGEIEQINISKFGHYLIKFKSTAEAIVFESDSGILLASLTKQNRVLLIHKDIVSKKEMLAMLMMAKMLNKEVVVRLDEEINFSGEYNLIASVIYKE